MQKKFINEMFSVNKVIIHRECNGRQKSSIQLDVEGIEVDQDDITVYSPNGEYVIPITNIKLNNEDGCPEYEIIDGDDILFIELLE